MWDRYGRSSRGDRPGANEKVQGHGGDDGQAGATLPAHGFPACSPSKQQWQQGEHGATPVIGAIGGGVGPGLWGTSQMQRQHPALLQRTEGCVFTSEVWS